MKRINSVLTLGTALLLLAFARPQAHAFTHPCAPTTLQELDTIKANLDKEPWKSGYAALAADGRSQLGYVMGGPFEVVKRNPNENLWPWRSDMIAFYNLSRMWYFTGNPAYAQKAHDIIIAWATVHKTFGGNEAGLDLGDYALCYGNGASILRGTWPGWTQQDTLTVQNYFRNVLWPSTAAPYNVSGPANKGSLNVAAGAVMAVFCDDTAMFNHVVDVFRNYPGSGLPNILPTGQMGETGRDMGHGFNDLLARTLTAEILWKQGIDVFSESDNRLLAAGEYHARNTSSPADTPFVPYGTVDYNYYQNAGALSSQDRVTYYLLQNAYKNRLGLPTPWIDRKLQEQGVHGGNFMFAKTVDFTTATPPPADPRPAISLASGGLTLTTLGTQTAGRSVSYANGVWTMTGLGNGTWTDTSDDCQFAYTAMTGDCAMVARVTSSQQQAGLMIRDNLTAAVSQRLWIATLSSTSPNKVESRSTGWTATWGGSNWARRSQDLPPGLPYWLMIERKGTVLTSYTSQDGTSWSPTISSDFGNLPATVYVGLIVSKPTTANAATFDNVAFTGGTGGLVTTPAAPAAMLASGSGKAITVRWLPSFGATAYDLLRSTTPGSGYTVIASDLTTAKTSYVDTTAAAGTTYYYVARAKNSAGISANSPEFSSSRLPAPLTNLALVGGGTVNDSANNSANAANAFDDDFGTQWFYGGTTGWLQYDFGANSAQVVKSYTIVSAPDFDTRDPKDWQFQGSNDGTAWTTLDAQANQTFAFRTYQRFFPLSNPAAYRYYRLNITSNNGDASFVHIDGLGLWGDSGRAISNGSYVVASRNTNKVLDVSGTANGTPVVQQKFTGGDTQQWTLAWQGNGWYRATSVATTGAKAIDNGGTSTSGANLVIQPTGAGTSQLWMLVPDNDGFYRVESANSGLDAGVSGGSTANGANITQTAYTGANSQQWMPGISVALQPVPAVPTALSGTAVSISQINLSWTGNSSAISYQLKRSTTNGGPYTAVSVPVNTTSYSDNTGLLSGTTYYYVVSAINGSGESANSAQASVTTPTAPPDAPASPTAILGTSGVTLSWTASGGATGYTVLRATTSGGPYTTVASGLTGTSYTDTSISHDTTYYYVIVATNANGSSPASSEITVGSGTLVAHLKFDETGGTLAADSSGRGQNATLVNGANFAAAGIIESGLNLPATASQYAALPSGIASGLTDFTIATWIKVNAFATWQRIFDFGTSTSNYMFLSAQGPAGAGRPRFAIHTASSDQFIDSSVALTAGTWAHIAVTRSGNTVSIYINGSLAGSGTLTTNPADLGFTTQNYLGKSQFADPYLNATLDDFRIYANALSQSEVAALATPAAGAPTRVAATPGDTQATVTWLPNATNTYTYTVKRSTTSGGPYTTVATGLTGLSYTDTGLANGTAYYYVVSAANAQGSTPDSAEASTIPNTLAVRLKFDESSGTVATDSSGRNFNATLVNGPVFAAGVMNNGLSLPATASQYATLPSGVVSGMADFTVSTWIKVNAFATWQRIFDFGSGTTNYMYLTTQYTTTAPNAAKLRFNIRTPSIAEQTVSGTGVALSAGVWTHVAVTRSGNTVSLYVNGSLSGSGTVTLKPSDLGATTLNYLGKSQWSSDPYLNGSLDEFRIYSRALSSSEIAIMATVLPAPASLAATAGTGQVALSWNSVSGASGYNVKRATTSGGPYVTIKADNASASYIDTTAVNGTTYYYVVSATNMGGESPASAEASATPLAPPAVPAGLTAVAGNATISLDWTAATGATSYNVKRATAPGGPYTMLASGVTGTSFDDNDLPSGTTYYYVVSGVNAVAESANSSEVSATTIPAVPTGLTTTPGNGQVSLSWSASTGASSYTILRATSANGPFTTIATGVTGTSYADTTALPGWTYYYAIAAGNSSGQSDSSASVAITAATATLSWLKLDETSGTTASDATGNANTGALVNAPTWIGGRIGNALNLSGTNQYVSLPASVTANLHDFTLSAWVYWNGGGNWQRIFDFGRGTTVNMFLTPKNGANGNPRFVITTSGAGGEQQINTTSALTTGTWHHIAITLSGSTGTLYIDGQQAGQNTGLTLRPADLGATTQNWIGRSQYNDPYLNGRVDDFRLYAGALSSTEIAALAAPIQTAGLTATGGSAQVALTWTATSGATSYTVRRATSAGGATTVVASGITGTSYTNTGLADGTTYFYVVTPANASGDGANSAEASTMTTPAAPGNVTATPGNGQIMLTWSASTGATSYNVLRATSANGSYTTVATGITGTSYTDTGLANGTTYYYAVIAVNGSGTSANSTQVNALTAPPAPAGLSATGSGTQVNLSWSAATGATSYTVKRSTTSGGAYTTIASGLTGTSYADTGLTAGTTYYYVVSATNAAGESANSSEVSGATVPAAPTGLASSGSGTQIGLSWSAASGAATYNVKRSITSGSSYATIASGVTVTNYTDTGLIAGATYYYVVTATNTAGEGSASAETATTLVTLAPTNLSAIGWNGQVDLSWSVTGGATSYKVKRATTSGGSYTTLATGVSSTTYSDTTAVNGTTYYYVVSANNAGGESANSAEASTTFTQPVAYLKFDETSGTSAADASGNNWIGTLVNGPLWSAGRSNNTVDLDGVNDHVTLPTGVVNGLTNFTISLWANLDTLSTWSRLFDFGTGTTVNMFLTPKNGNNSKIRFAITTGGGNGEQRIDGTAALPIGGWHHVAVTLNGSTGTLYVDGVQVGQNTAMTLNPSSLGSTTQNRIGRSQYNDPYLMGRIDEFRIYGRSLSAAEVASLMNTSPTGLVSAPASLTATPGTGQVVLNWSAVSGATSFDVLRATTSAGPFLDVATGLTTTTYANTGLTAGTTYYYVIVAHTATSESPNSPVASAVAQ